jgi:uncharacterized membrane protein
LSTPRLYFIDAVRAFAILMMLQGHFVDTLLAPEYRDLNSTVYKTWLYFRGITAPIFFTISGLVFTYLLLKAKEKGNTQERIKKGLWRGLMLIGIGYALRIPVFQWLKLEFSSNIFVIDVLQIIGLSLILIIALYQLLGRKTRWFSLAVLIIGTLIFTTEPLYRNLSLPNWPLALSNYLSKSNGSIFTLLPWFGYISYGAFMATIFYRYLGRPRFKSYVLTGWLIIGILLILYSSKALIYLYYKSEIQIFYEAANYNYLFTRLGDVLVIFTLFYAFEHLLKQRLVLKIGQKTLSIYVIHFIIIYGSFTGWGLNRLIGKTLNPTQAVLGAILFLTTVCLISFYYMKPNVFIYKQLRKLLDRQKARKESLD